MKIVYYYGSVYYWEVLLHTVLTFVFLAIKWSEFFTEKKCATVQDWYKTKWARIFDGERVSSLRKWKNGWNDQVDWINFNDGCYATVCVHDDFEGTCQYLYQGKDSWKLPYNKKHYEIRSDGWVYRWWANDISSIECNCVWVNTAIWKQLLYFLG